MTDRYCGHYLAWHPAVRDAILRHKHPHGLAEWYRRRWDAFPSTPTIEDVSALMSGVFAELGRIPWRTARLAFDPAAQPCLFWVHGADVTPAHDVTASLAQDVLAFHVLGYELERLVDGGKVLRRVPSQRNPLTPWP